MKARILLVFFAVGVAVPAAFLVAFGIRGVSLERRRLEAERQGRIEDEIRGIRERYAELFSDVEKRECRRGVFDYLPLSAPDPVQSVSNSLVLNSSPLANDSAEGDLVKLYFQIGAGGVLTTPYDQEDPPAAAESAPRSPRTALVALVREDWASRVQVLLMSLGSALRMKGADLGCTQQFEASQFKANQNYQSVKRMIDDANQGDEQKRRELDELSRQRPNQRARAVQKTVSVPVSKVAFEAVGDRLYGYRIADLGGEGFVFQGFLLDREALLGRFFRTAVQNVDAALFDVTLIPPGAPARAGAAPLSPNLPGALVSVEPKADDIDARVSVMRTGVLLTATALGAILLVGFAILGLSLRAERRLLRKREDLVSAITHELRTPLTGIRMHAEMLNEGWLRGPDAARKYLGTILAESERLTRLVENVLDFTRLRDERRKLRIVEQDPAAPVQDVLELLRARAEANGVVLAFDGERAPARAAFDRDAYVQALMNLVDNAIKYSRRPGETGPKTVTVLLRSEGRGFAASVKDEGVGVPEREKRSIFEPFYRVEDEMTRTTRGSGIGLALVAMIMKAHRGRVEVESAVGRGSRFSLVFPPLAG